MIGGTQGIGGGQIDLVLARRNLVMAALNLDAAGAQRGHQIMAQPGALVGAYPKVAVLIFRQRMQPPISISLADKKFDLRRDLITVAAFGGGFQGFAQNIARVASKAVIIHAEQVAHQQRLAFRRICGRDDSKRRRVGAQQHIAFVQPHRALDAGAVGPLAARQHKRQTLRRNADALHLPTNVDKLKRDSLNVAFCDGRQHRLHVRCPWLGIMLTIHGLLSCFPDATREAACRAGGLAQNVMLYFHREK